MTAPHLLWINHFAVAPADGGGTRHFELARELTTRGWRVTIAASDFHLHSRGYTRRVSAAARAPITERIDDVDFLWLWAAPYATNDWRRANNWISFASSLGRWSPNGSRPDVIIGSSPHLFAALAGRRLATRLGVPFVMEVRDLWPESLVAAGGRRGPVYHALDVLARHLYGSASRIIVLAHGAGDYLRDRGVDARKLVLVPNGADPYPLAPAAVRGADAFTLVYAGAHGPANGLDVVLGAASLLRGEHVRIILVGDGPSKRELMMAASAANLDNVEFRDPVPKTAMPALLASADAGLMVLRDAPLFSYGVSPNKLFDYLAAGLPVVCNVAGEVASMLAASGAGEQTSDASARALADAMRHLAHRPLGERTAMGAAGRDWLTREHSRAVLASRLDAALHEVMTT